MNPVPIVCRLEAVIVDRDGRRTLDVPGLELRAGEVLGLLGRNGAGKSTLVRVMAGLEAPTSGRCWLFGQPVGFSDADLPLRRRAAVVLQRSVLLSGTVRENVELGSRLRGRPTSDVARWMATLDIEHLADRRVTGLSGGEARRVVLARALAAAPELLFLDEPFAGLDRPTRDALLELLPPRLLEAGTTVVLVTHDRDELRGWTDRLGIVAGGRIVELGPAGSMWQAASTSEGRRLLGLPEPPAGCVS